MYTSNKKCECDNGSVFVLSVLLSLCLVVLEMT